MKAKTQCYYYKRLGKTYFKLISMKCLYLIFIKTTNSYLIKNWDWALQGKTLVPTLSYLNKFVENSKPQKWNQSITLSGIIESLQAVAAKYICPTHDMICFK